MSPKPTTHRSASTRRRGRHHADNASPNTTRDDRPGHSPTDGEAGERLLTVAEAAQRLGKGERYARRLIAERRIDYVKFGTARCSPVRIPEHKLKDWIAANTVEPTE